MLVYSQQAGSPQKKRSSVAPKLEKSSFIQMIGQGLRMQRAHYTIWLTAPLDRYSTATVANTTKTQLIATSTLFTISTYHLNYNLSSARKQSRRRHHTRKSPVR